MKLLKLLNNKNFFFISVLFLSFFTQLSFAEDSVDIWNIKNSNQKRSGFAGARLGFTNHIIAAQGVGQRHSLNRGAVLKAGIGNAVH